MVIIITGSSSGIGHSLAEYLGSKGHNVYGLSRKTSQSTLFHSIATDITDKPRVEAAIAEILNKESRIDVLINNAGMGMVGAVEDASQEEILQLFNLNLIGATQMIRAVLPSMRLQRSGKIINISSIGSEMGLPFRGFYSASKAALDKITEALRYEIDLWKIQATSLHLGDIQTNIAEHRICTKISPVYQDIFQKVYAIMNAHVTHGTSPTEVASYVERLLEKSRLKPHYYFGKTGQKMAVPIKKMLPQLWFEKLMKTYNGLK